MQAKRENYTRLREDSSTVFPIFPLLKRKKKFFKALLLKVVLAPDACTFERTYVNKMIVFVSVALFSLPTLVLTDTTLLKLNYFFKRTLPFIPFLPMNSGTSCKYTMTNTIKQIYHICLTEKPFVFKHIS